MLLRSTLLVLLVVVVVEVFGDSKPAERAHNYDEDRQEETNPAEDRSASGGGRRKTEYTPEEKEEYNLSAEEDGESPEDEAKDEKTSYSTMVSEPGQQRSMSYKDGGSRTSKTYYKTYRQVGGSNYKPYKSPKLVEKYRSPPPAESFFTGVHPSVMRNLLKQEPQTFTDSQQGQTQETEQGSPNWQVTTNSENRFGSLKTGYSLQRDQSGRHVPFGINKNPIYVPNRVSVQNPSSDSSFNVGYSIGFGNGQAQPLAADFSNPSTNLRQGKAISVPMSYQNTPVSLHFNGRDTFWKSMGSGVEISQSVDVNPKPYQAYNDKPLSDYNQSPVPVTPHPSYTSDGVGDYPTPGPYTFDHNHALQQSNSFDFSNAIDPTTNKPYSTDKLNQMNKESFPKPHLSSFADSTNTHYFESSPRQSRPSHVELSKETKSHSVFPHHSHNGDRQGKFEAYKHDLLRYEPSSFSDSSLKSPNPVTYHPKLMPIDFSQSLSSGPKAAPPPSYPLKATSTINTHQISASNYDTLGFPGFPITPQMFTPAGKIPPPGMIQAILVPVNAPGSSPFSYPVGMPMVGNGYSPYLGHPLGMVRIPEPVGAEPALHGGSELQTLELNSQSHPEEYLGVESSPAKQVHTHYTIVKHIKEQPAEPSQYHFQKASYPVRMEDNHHTVKIKKVFATEAPVFVTSPATYYPSPHFPQPISSNPQLPRLHGASMIIVKRT